MGVTIARLDNQIKPGMDMNFYHKNFINTIYTYESWFLQTSMIRWYVFDVIKKIKITLIQQNGSSYYFVVELLDISGWLK